MNLESLKEQLIERLSGIWERIRDSDSYIQLKERYQSLSPTMQRIANVVGIFVAAMIVMAIPLSFLTSSSDSIETFENNVNLIRQFYRVQRELQTTPMVPETPSSGEISTRVQSVVQAAGLSGDQINGPREISPDREANNALQPPGITEHGAEITLIKINVKQVADIGAKLSQLAPGLHLTSLDMKANTENDHYYDVIFRVTGFSVPGAETASPKDDSAAKAEPPPSPSSAKTAPPVLPPPPGRLKPKPEPGH